MFITDEQSKSRGRVAESTIWKLKAAQTRQYLEGVVGPDPNAPFKVWIDYYGDDHEMLPKKDTVEIDPEIYTVNVASDGLVMGVIVDGPPPLVGRKTVVALNMKTYKGFLAVVEGSDAIPTDRDSGLREEHLC